MADVPLNVARSGVQLLSALFKAADEEGFINERVNGREVNSLIDQYGDGATMDAAMLAVQAYAQARYQTSAPTLKELDRALGQAMRSIARGDLDKDKDIDPKERELLAKTWKAVLDFSADYEGYNLADIVQPSSAP